MNLFQKYGIKEVADVVFYSITSIGDETIYTPVLFLDTLKVSTLEKTAEKVSAKGGKGNKKLISWNYGKDITLNLEDALFTPASMSLIWSDKLNAKLSNYTSAIVKSNLANKYGKMHYSVKAYASPILTDKEWDIVFKAATEQQIACPNKVGDSTVWYVFDNTATKENQIYIKENQINLKKAYINRIWPQGASNIDGNYNAMPIEIINQILNYIDTIGKLGTIETNSYNIEVIDRFERCVVRDKNGLRISTQQQKQNLLRYYANDKSSSYIIFYDEKTMQPLFNITDGNLNGWNDEEDLEFILKFGTPYYKWSRTVKYNDGDDDSSLGRVLVIDSDTFSGDYKIVGETYIRNQKTGKDQRYQFSINRAQISSDTNISLQADGDPTTFSMNIEVLTPKTGDMIELYNFDVDEDVINGGTRISPMPAQYTYTATEVPSEEEVPERIINNEII